MVAQRDSVCSLPLSFATNYGIAIAFSCLRVLRCFSSPRVPPLPGNSGTPGSKAVCASPGLFAAYHALHRTPSQAIHQMAYCEVILISLSIFQSGTYIDSTTAMHVSASGNAYVKRPLLTSHHEVARDVHLRVLQRGLRGAAIGPDQIRCSDGGCEMGECQPLLWGAQLPLETLGFHTPSAEVGTSGSCKA